MDTKFTLETKPEYTLEDYDKLPESNIKVELVNGGFYMSPPPIDYHQDVIFTLMTKIKSVLPDNLHTRFETGIRISKNKYFIPDIVIGYKNKILNKGKSDYPPECFVLVVEVESKSSKSIDRIAKHDAYEEAGIECYVRVVMDDVNNPEVYVYELNVYELDNNKYKQVSHAKSGEIVNIYNPIKLSFDPKELIS